MMSALEYINTIPNILREHQGEWIVIVGEEIIYIGHRPEIGYTKAKKKYPASSPFVMYIMGKEFASTNF